MLRAYLLVYPARPHAPQQLWEWQQPHVDHLVLNARTFSRRVVGWWFADWQALDQDNTRIWETYYRPKPAFDHLADWQAWLPEHRQVIVEVQAIAAETGWRGPVRA